MDTLSSLVDSSLVRPEPREDEPRFSLLDTIREYALERLRESGDWQDVHDRHAAYFLTLAEPADVRAARCRAAGLAQSAGDTPRQPQRRAVLADRAAISPGGRSDLVWATWRFWWLHGHAEELARHVDKILAHSDGMPPQQRALALSGAGFVRFAGGDQAQGPAAVQAEPAAVPPGRGPARHGPDRGGPGAPAGRQGTRSRSPATCSNRPSSSCGRWPTSQLTEPERVQYLLDVALASNFLGQIQLDQEDHHRAAELFTDGLSAAHSAADRFTVLVSLYDLALSRQAGGDLDDAADLLRQGLSLAAEAGDEPGLAYYLEALAAVAVRQDQPERAASLLAAAGALLEANGSGWLHAYVPRAPHDDSVLAALRARTTDAAFQQAWAHGRSLTSTSAVRYALEETTGRPALPALAAG